MRIQIERPRFFVIVMALVLIVFMLISVPSFCAIASNNRAIAAAKAENKALTQENVRLQSELEFAATDDYIIQVARNELGYVMPGEIRYQTN